MSVRDAWSKGSIERISRQSETTKIQVKSKAQLTYQHCLEMKRGENDGSPKSSHFPHLICELVQHYNLNRCRLQ